MMKADPFQLDRFPIQQKSLICVKTDRTVPKSAVQGIQNRSVFPDQFGPADILYRIGNGPSLWRINHQGFPDRGFRISGKDYCLFGASGFLSRIIKDRCTKQHRFPIRFRIPQCHRYFRFRFR